MTTTDPDSSSHGSIASEPHHNGTAPWTTAQHEAFEDRVRRRLRMMTAAIAIIGAGCTFAFWSNDQRDTQREQDRAEVALVTCQLRNASQRDNRDSTAARDRLRRNDQDATVAFLRSVGAEEDVIKRYQDLFDVLPPVPKAEDQDSDCDHDGALTSNDYASGNPFLE